MVGAGLPLDHPIRIDREGATKELTTRSTPTGKVRYSYQQARGSCSALPVFWVEGLVAVVVYTPCHRCDSCLRETCRDRSVAASVEYRFA